MVRQYYKTCPDCGVEVGGKHNIHCYVPRCGHCGDQYLSCGCDLENTEEESIWKGYWPYSDEEGA